MNKLAFLSWLVGAGLLGSPTGFGQTQSPTEPKASKPIRVSLLSGIGWANVWQQLSPAYIERPDGIWLGSRIAYRFGLGIQYRLPTESQSWNVFAELTLQEYIEEDNRPVLLNDESITLANTAYYRSIELPIGLRRYWRLSRNWSGFWQVAALLDLPVGDSYVGATAYGPGLAPDESIWPNLRPSVSGLVGIGWHWKNRLSGEVRYYLPRGLMMGRRNNRSIYQSFSLMFGIWF